MKKTTVLIAALLSLSSLSFASQEMAFTPEQGKVEFLAKGWPALLKIKGKSSGPEGKVTIKDNKASGTIKLNLASFKTGISLRDDHMKNNYLHVKKFPEALLKISNVELPKDLKGKSKFTGILSLHGVDKPVSGKLSMKGVKKGKAKLKAEFDIKISEFAIEIPSFKGVTVAEDVSIKLTSDVLVSDVSPVLAKTEK